MRSPTSMLASSLHPSSPGIFRLPKLMSAWSFEMENLKGSPGRSFLSHSCESRNPDSGPRIKSGVTASFRQIGQQLWPCLYALFADIATKMYDHPFTINSIETKSPIIHSPDTGQLAMMMPPRMIETIPPKRGHNQFLAPRI
jgi:hypothetical protein